MKEKCDWGALQSFPAVVRAGRLTAAAQVLGVTHSTLSRRIAALERSLQAQLFNRSPAGYALTDRGRAVLEAAEAMESLAVSAQAEAGSARLRVAGTVRIGAPDGFGTRFLAPRLPNLTRRHPALLIQLVTMPRVFSLSKREADIAIGLTAPEQGRLHVRKLVDYQLGPYDAPTYLDTAGMPNTLEDLGRHRVIGYIDDLIYTPELDHLPLVAPGLRPSFASSNLLAQKEAIEAGHGLGVCRASWPIRALACAGCCRE
jgi:DNA-binding transcriptional LysR family regulator